LCSFVFRESRVILQIITDRFARTDGSTAPCSNFRDYCGGTYVGILNKLDYISNMGFDAIWISPIIKNTEKAYHGYSPLDNYELNEHFGTKEEFLNLIKECHKRGIWIMIDTVLNHMV
jgi:alpha-amylase